MATNSNSNVAFNMAGAATVTATVCVSLTSAHARIYTIPLGLAVLVALVGLTTWNLSRGGSAALGNFTLSGRKPTRTRTSRPAAPPHQPTPPGSKGKPPAPAPAAAQPASRGGGAAAAAIVLILLAGVIACALIPASSQPAAGATANAHEKAAASAGPASVVYAYYAAVNDREWPKAWALAGQPAPVGSAAYSQWADGYGCTVRDQVTSITAHGAALLVSVRAQESGGVTQTYRFSYVVRDGVLTHPQMLSFTGHAPQGCGK
jgi:hypothetical protein